MDAGAAPPVSTHPRLAEPVAVLMPVYNEARLIRDVLDEWIGEVFAYLPDGSQFIFDDCSDDGTEVTLRDYAARYPFIAVNSSVRDGFIKAAKRLHAAVRCPLAFFTDSDGQYVAQDFWDVAAHIGTHDMVHGYKQRRKDPLYRVAASSVFNRVVQVMFGSVGHDVNSAFRLIRREALQWVAPRLSQMPALLNAEMYIRLEWEGFRIKEVPIRHRFRRFSKSRGLPLKSFPIECVRAFGGLVALRRELTAEP